MTTTKLKKIPVSAEECCSSLMSAPLSEGDAADLGVGFAALADPIRLRLISLLANAPDGAVCACDLVEPLGKSQPTVSHHLKALTEAGLIRGERQGRWIWYSVVTERLDALRNAIKQ